MIEKFDIESFGEVLSLLYEKFAFLPIIPVEVIDQTHLFVNAPVDSRARLVDRTQRFFHIHTTGDYRVPRYYRDLPSTPQISECQVNLSSGFTPPDEQKSPYSQDLPPSLAAAGLNFGLINVAGLSGITLDVEYLQGADNTGKKKDAVFSDIGYLQWPHLFVHLLEQFMFYCSDQEFGHTPPLFVTLKRDPFARKGLDKKVLAAGGLNEVERLLTVGDGFGIQRGFSQVELDRLLHAGIHTPIIYEGLGYGQPVEAELIIGGETSVKPRYVKEITPLTVLPDHALQGWFRSQSGL